MKKIVPLTILFMASLIFYPHFTQATVVELSVNIDSFTVPARAYKDFANTRPSSQYHIYGGRISVTDKNNLFVESEALTRPTNECSDCYGYMMKDNYAVISFPYSASLAPYKVYPELRVNKQGTNTYCAANCGQIDGNAGYYFTGSVYFVDRWDGVETVDSSYCGNGFCPDAFDRNAIAIPPTNIYTYYCESTWIDCDSAGTQESYYFRWPAVFTIN